MAETKGLHDFSRSLSAVSESRRTCNGLRPLQVFHPVLSARKLYQDLYQHSPACVGNSNPTTKSSEINGGRMPVRDLPRVSHHKTLNVCKKEWRMVPEARLVKRAPVMAQYPIEQCLSIETTEFSFSLAADFDQGLSRKLVVRNIFRRQVCGHCEELGFVG